MASRFLSHPRAAIAALAVVLAPGVAHAGVARAVISPAKGSSAPAPGSDGVRRTEPAAALLSGVVRDTTGRPLANVSVALPALQRQTSTNEEGRFTFRGVPAGTYVVNAFQIGFALARATVVVPATGTAPDIVLVMRSSVVRLGSVQVTATPTGTDPLQLTQSTLDLSGKALERALGASVATTLANEPGISQRFNGPVANMPVIRGLTGERILVLQDGQRAGDLSAAAQDHAVTIDPLAAQRIEVVRGPASLLYGTQALGGVVNVISSDIPTQVPSHVQGVFSAQGESVNPGGAGSLSVTAPLGQKVAVLARGTVRHAEDFRVGGGEGAFFNTYQRTQGGVLGLGFSGDRATGGVVYRGNRFDYGLPAPADDDEAGGHIEGWRNEAAGRTDITLGAGAFTTLRLDGNAQWYHHDEIENTGDIGTSFELKTQTLNATARTQFGRARGALGFQGLFRQYASTGEEALTPAANYTNLGAFVFQEIPLGGDSVARAGSATHSRVPTLQVGARYDRFDVASKDSDNPKFGAGRTVDFNTFSSSLGLSVPIGPLATLSGSVARGFRGPTVEELYSNAFHAAVGTYDVGNPNLKAEINTGVDGVFRVQSGKSFASLSAYYNRIGNFITPVITGVVDPETGDPVPAGTEGAVPRNQFGQADATLHGVEGQVEAEVAPRIVAGLMGDLVRGSFANNGGNVPYLPPARLGASLRYDTGHFSLGGDVRHAFAQDRTSQAACGTAGGDLEDVVPGSAGVPCVDVATGAYTLVNLTAGWTFNAGGRLHSVMLRADNVGDVRYFDAASRIKSFVGNPGRNVSLVYRLLF